MPSLRNTWRSELWMQRNTSGKREYLLSSRVWQLMARSWQNRPSAGRWHSNSSGTSSLMVPSASATSRTRREGLCKRWSRRAAISTLSPAAPIPAERRPCSGACPAEVMRRRERTANNRIWGKENRQRAVRLSPMLHASKTGRAHRGCAITRSAMAEIVTV